MATTRAERRQLQRQRARRVAPPPVDSKTGKLLGCALQADHKVGDLTIATGHVANFLDSKL
jgi:hypothetical protein